MRITSHHTSFLLVAAVALLSFVSRDIGRPAAVTAPSGKLQEVIKALKSGNAEQLSKYFDSYVDLTLPEKRVITYSRRQAIMVLSDFFETYKVKSFSPQPVTGAGSSDYCIGTLQTSGGAFRTTLFIATEGDRTMIREINFH